jgi:uncharacterized protein YraI
MFAPASAQAVNPAWRGDYFNNATLSGDPVVSRSDANIAFSWGTGAPVDGVPADNFSVRWGTDVPLTAGTYRITAWADDNIRVIFDFQETPLIDTFDQVAAGQQVTADFTVPADGTYHIQVDYRELTDNAFANIAIVNLSGTLFAAGAPDLEPTSATASVLAGRLNVRDEPSTQTGDIITVINRNESYPIIATNDDNTWYLLSVGDLRGWVSANWVTVSPADANIPVAEAEDIAATAEATAAAPTGDFVVTATPFTVNIRSGPGIQNARLGRLPVGQSAEVIGRNSDNTWWQINFNGITGWVSAEFALMAEGVDVTGIPVTDTGTDTTAEATETP